MSGHCTLSPEEASLARELLQQAGGWTEASFPRKYLCLDVETTGLDPKTDLIVQTGHCVVNDCKLASQRGHVISWLDNQYVELGWLQDRLDFCKQNMLDKVGHWHGIDIEVMRSRGRPPGQVFENQASLLKKARESGYRFVGHNLTRFDVPRIQSAIEEWTGLVWTFREHELVDTCAIEKALRLGMRPIDGESHYSLAKRVLSRRVPGLKHSLDDILQRYDLYDRVPKHLLHTATGDALACHVYLEKLRQLSGMA